MHAIARGMRTRMECLSPLLRSRKRALFTLRHLVLLAAFACCSPAGAYAQLNPFRGYNGPTLAKPDIDAGRVAADRLLGSDPKPVGTVETWTGPTSGNSGTLTVERTYQKQGHQCSALRSRVTYKEGTDRSSLLQVCRVGGQWKLAD